MSGVERELKSFNPVKVRHFEAEAKTLTADLLKRE